MSDFETSNHSHQRRFGRNPKEIMPKKQSEELLQQVVVEYDPSEKSFWEVKYKCPICREGIWLKYQEGRHTVTCRFCKNNFTLNIK